MSGTADGPLVLRSDVANGIVTLTLNRGAGGQRGRVRFDAGEGIDAFLGKRKPRWRG